MEGKMGREKRKREFAILLRKLTVRVPIESVCKFVPAYILQTVVVGVFAQWLLRSTQRQDVKPGGMLCRG